MWPAHVRYLEKSVKPLGDRVTTCKAPANEVRVCVCVSDIWEQVLIRISVTCTDTCCDSHTTAQVEMKVLLEKVVIQIKKCFFPTLIDA